MKKNKNKIVIVLISVILVIGLLFLIGPHNKPYTGITYFARNERACLVFHKNGKYSMNNCDGEPTNYFFDDEHECTYKYLKEENKLEFNCEIEPDPNGTIKVLEWDIKHIKFIYKGKTKTFYSRFKLL